MTFNLVKYAFNGLDVIDSALAPHATSQLYTHLATLRVSKVLLKHIHTSTHLHLNTYKKQ